MAASSDTIQAIATYLGVKCGKITFDGLEKVPVMKGKTGTRRGFATITKHLTRAADQQTLIGESCEEKAVVDQWLEYRVCTLDRCPSEKDLEAVLHDLNVYLADKVFFWNHRLSLIDLVFYYGLHSIMRDLTYYQKQKYSHLSRWFDNVQQNTAIQQSYDRVPFSKTKLYSGSAH